MLCGAIANAYGCKVDEGSVHPCIINGHDYGELLCSLGVMGWFMTQFIARNPGLSRVAIDGTTVVGVAMCGHDGRRGYIYHLAVDPAYRRYGLGKRLVRECLDGLHQAGVVRAIILVSDNNLAGAEFWKRAGWEDIPGALAMGIDV